MKTPREILEELCKEYRKHNGVGCSHQFDQALFALREVVLGKKKDDVYNKRTDFDNGRIYGWNDALQDIANLFGEQSKGVSR